MNRHAWFSVIILVLCLLLYVAPTGFEKPEEPCYERVVAEVVRVDNSMLEQIGFVKTGSQEMQIKILKGRFKDRIVDAPNLLMGKLEMDKIFVPGDQALVVLSYDHDTILSARAIDFYRMHTELFLLGLFAVLLVSFAGWTGFQALISFAFTLLMIWKILIPLFLKGVSPLWVSVGVVTLLCAATIFLVAGVNKKGLVAFLGATAGVLSTCILAVIFGQFFKVHGAVVPYAESLLHSGYGNLDLTAIFLSGIYLASSGAIMDIAMDLSASMNEVLEKKPDIGRAELLASGISVGRAVIGTMTTTLLLAYSGGYTALLMLFMAQGVPFANIMNYTFVSAEILHTLVGSFGLVLTAPITAFIGAVVFPRKEKSKVLVEQEIL